MWAKGGPDCIRALPWQCPNCTHSLPLLKQLEQLPLQTSRHASAGEGAKGRWGHLLSDGCSSQSIWQIHMFWRIQQTSLTVRAITHPQSSPPPPPSRQPNSLDGLESQVQHLHRMGRLLALCGAFSSLLQCCLAFRCLLCSIDRPGSYPCTKRLSSSSAQASPSLLWPSFEAHTAGGEAGTQAPSTHEPLAPMHQLHQLCSHNAERSIQAGRQSTVQLCAGINTNW
jgi:hypothetical protein